MFRRFHPYCSKRRYRIKNIFFSHGVGSCYWCQLPKGGRGLCSCGEKTLQSISSSAVFGSCFVCDLRRRRRRRRGSTLTKRHHQCWNVFGLKKPALKWFPNQFDSTSRASMLNLSQRVETTQPTNTKARLEPDVHSKKAKAVHTTSKLKGRKSAGPLRTNQQRLLFHFVHFLAPDVQGHMTT